MPTATVHVATSELELTGSYEPTGDVLSLSAAGGDKQAAASKPRRVTWSVSTPRGASRT